MATSYTQEDLDLVIAAIRARLAKAPVESKQVGGRQIKYMSLTELRELRKEIEDKLNAEVCGGPCFSYIVPTRHRAY